MTLAAVRVDADHAEILTDTVCGSPGNIFVLRSSKLVVFPHLSLAVIGRGASELGGWWGGWLQAHPDVAQTFGDLDAHAQERLPQIWQEVPDKVDGRSAARVIHVGWDDDAGRFRCLEYRSVDGFRGSDITDVGFFVHPDPSPRLLPPPPSCDRDWADLAEMIYSEISTNNVLSNRQCLIGGDILLTRLERKSVAQRVVHNLPEDHRFREAMIGSHHWYGQVGPCICGSGQPAIVCHLRWTDPDTPCLCGSGQPFDVCHRIDPYGADMERAVDHWIDHAGDFHRTQPALADAWRILAPDIAAIELPPPDQIIPPAGDTH